MLRPKGYIKVEYVAQDSCNGVTYSTRIDGVNYTYGVSSNETSWGHNNYQSCGANHYYRRCENTQWNNVTNTYTKNACIST